MKVRRGFTIVELMIVIVIMGVLLTIGTVMYRGYQASARDKERESDITAVQTYLESIYAIEIKDGAGNILKPAGEYPALPALKTEYSNSSVLASSFDELGVAVMTPPGVTYADTRTMLDLPAIGQYLPAEGDRTVAYCTSSPSACYVRPNAISPTIGQYIYAPGPADNTLCTRSNNGSNVSGACRRYALYYRTEADGVIKKVESRHR